MRLHENKELFADAIQAASRGIDDGGLGIRDIFIEKDYWICRSLRLMALADTNGLAVHKGGTSLSKAYGIGARFSEDIDIAILDADKMSGNKLKTLIGHLSKEMSRGLDEIVIPGVTSKGSHYRKEYFAYPRAVETEQLGAIRSGQLLLEINAFANPFPYTSCTIKSFLTEFLESSGNQSLIDEYDMQPFTLSVLDKRRTLTEKLVSLIRCSLADNYLYELSAKIRHFYDLHFLLDDPECREYLKSTEFKEDFDVLLSHDRKLFAKPDGWQTKDLSDSPLITNLSDTWEALQETYNKEMPGLAYKSIPTVGQIQASIRTILCII